MSRTILAGLITAWLLAIGATRGDDDGKTSELKVLDHYVGVWNVEIVSKNPFVTGTAKAEWVLNGRFVQQESEAHSADGKSSAKYKILFTYDPIRKKYRRWVFVSDGMTSEGEGVWDAAARTMTFVTRDAQVGSTMTVTSDFSAPEIETWHIVNTDRAGKVLFERSGQNTRQKK
jgi:hypothetical protein